MFKTTYRKIEDFCAEREAFFQLNYDYRRRRWTARIHTRKYGSQSVTMTHKWMQRAAALCLEAARNSFRDVKEEERYERQRRERDGGGN